ncbi:MAG: molybdenum cofactor biosynthesis protein B [Candidatus Limnocylindrales bacterium]
MPGPAGPAAFVLTVSDGVTAGTREDRSGARLAARLHAAGYTVTRGVVADDATAIVAAVRRVATTEQLVVLTGGTGLTPRDTTPQAVRPVLDYEIPGFGEVMRAEGRHSTPFASLSRSFGGVLGRTLVLALPGSPAGAEESLAAVLDLLPHALETLADDSSRHARGSAGHGVDG